MGQVLEFFAFTAGAIAAFLAALSGAAWLRSAVLPLPELPPAPSAPPPGIPGVTQKPISVFDLNKTAYETAIALYNVMQAAQEGAELNKKAAKLSMLAALATAVALVLPVINKFGIWAQLWAATN